MAVRMSRYSTKAVRTQGAETGESRAMPGSASR